MKASTMPVTVPSSPSIGAMLPQSESVLICRNTARTSLSNAATAISCRSALFLTWATRKTAPAIRVVTEGFTWKYA